MPGREHAARRLLGNQKAPERADGDSLRNIGRDQIYEYTTRAAACVINDNVGRAAVVLDTGKQPGYIIEIGRVTCIGRGTSFFAKRGELVSLARCQGDADTLAGEKPRQRCAQTLTSTDDQCCLILHRLHERSPSIAIVM